VERVSENNFAAIILRVTFVGWFSKRDLEIEEVQARESIFSNRHLPIGGKEKSLLCDLCVSVVNEIENT
jgi:hypothetical protein